MTRTAPKRKAKRRNAPVKPKPKRVTSDQSIYLGIVLIGFFAVMLASLFTEVHHWPKFAIAYVAIVAYLIIACTFSIYRGKHLTNWQNSLARIPLRFVGYGTKHGKPLEAAHGHPEVRTALIVTILVSVIVVAGLAAIVWLNMR